MTIPAQPMIDKVLADHPEAEVVKRDRSQIRHRLFYLPDGREMFRSGISQGALHYKDGFGTWREINTALSPTAARVGADVGNVTSGFESHFRLNLGADWIAEYRKDTAALRLKPVRLQSGAKSWLAQPVLGVVNDDVIRWKDAFGPDIHLEWETQASRLAKKVILDKALTLTADLDLVIEVQLDNLGVPIITGTSPIPVGNIGHVRRPVSTDATGEQVQGQLSISKIGAKRYLTHRIPRAWLAAATYPVAIDVDIDEYVTAGADDTYCQYRISTSTHSFSTTIAYCAVGDVTTLGYKWRGAAMRFSAVDIPRDSIIQTAYWYGYVNVDQTADTCRAYLYGHAHDNSPQVTTDAELHALATAKTTGILDTAPGDWVIPNWFGYAIDVVITGAPYTILSDIISRPGWVADNALTIVYEDWDGRSDANATRTWYSYNGDSTHPPWLDIRWLQGVVPQGMMV